MPRLTKGEIAYLKSRMLPRLDTKKFTDQDIQEIIDYTELSEMQIKDWADTFRYRFVTAPDNEVIAFLKQPEDDEFSKLWAENKQLKMENAEIMRENATLLSLLHDFKTRFNSFDDERAATKRARA